jgi:hypothetical protein
VDGCAPDLAGDVPERLVDAGDGAAQDRSAPIEAALGQDLPVILDAQRIGAGEVVEELGNAGGDRLRPSLDDRGGTRNVSNPDIFTGRA